uniref:1-deoxy-D-xylulose-5-phosphate synthase n=1 Tax=Lygus hesperus TaxID=30085 RepID=A0A0A9WCE3_LYGHE
MPFDYEIRLKNSFNSTILDFELVISMARYVIIIFNTNALMVPTTTVCSGSLLCGYAKDYARGCSTSLNLQPALTGIIGLIGNRLPTSNFSILESSYLTEFQN